MQNSHNIDNSVLLNLAKEFGTPLYVYDLDKVKEQYTKLLNAITYRDLRVLYAMKANYNPDILRFLCQAGAGIDAVSPAEVLLALRCGFSADRIMYTANNLTDQEMQEVAKNGVQFNLGSLSELERYGKLFPERSVCLRINPAVVAGSHEKIRTGGDLTKFGILMDDIPQALQIADRFQLKITGLHKHTGSGINEKEKFLEAARNLLRVARKQDFPDLQFIDFGGGLYVPYHPDDIVIDYPEFGAQISALMQEFSDNFGRKISLVFEPGKYMVAQSGYLIVEVNTLKKNRDRLIVGTNSGFPQLIRPVFYDAYHHLRNLSNPQGPENTYDVCGNICETGDHFAKDRKLPEIREGDILSIENAGAYCYSMGGVYNLRAMPTEVVVENGKARLSRSRLNNEQLVANILSECP